MYSREQSIKTIYIFLRCDTRFASDTSFFALDTRLKRARYCRRHAITSFKESVNVIGELGGFGVSVRASE